MFSKSHLALLSGVLITGVSEGRVIYGFDHRVEVYDASPLQQKSAHSAATMVSHKKITRDPLRPGVAQLDQTSFRENFEILLALLEGPDADPGRQTEVGAPNFKQAKALAGKTFCDGERFIQQPNAGTCSGFLIAPDLLVTAGHCVDDDLSCTNYSWVFDYQVDKSTQKAGVDVKEENIYNCKKVISNALLVNVGLDYGVVQLDRPVVGRTPLEVRFDKKIPDGAGLYVVGSPSGMPLKVAGGGSVRTNTHPYNFDANLDTFQGNSGSGVFNAETGVVEGILVNGENDFEENKTLSCITAKKCTDEGCRGEGVTRLTAIPEIGARPALVQAAVTGNMVNLERIFKLNLYADFALSDGETVLMKAAAAGQDKVVEFLITKGADVNKKDAKGNTALHHLARKLEKSRDKVLAVLLSAKANVNSVNSEGETALFILARRGEVGLVQDLVKIGADALVKNNLGVSVLDLSDGRGKPVLKKLRKKLLVSK